ncbi:MAG TPA: DUF4058 family protein [Gemmataceae bacterium]|nr:DUF4058 family protein [Gemmataceae bacterium]
MPLLDHFHKPIYPLHSWTTLHSRWAGTLMDALNALLPASRYLVEVTVSVGPHIEADIAEFELPPSIIAEEVNGSEGGVAVAVQPWAPPAAVQTLDIVFPDDIEVQVFDLRDGKRLVAAIELVSPSNKDRSEERQAFAAKCVAYLQRGIGLIVVDIVTNRRGNLHHEILDLLGQADASVLLPETELYASAYRPAHRGDKNQLDLWPVALAVDQPLPLLPLALRGAFFVPVDLEATYVEARQRCRL